jgi:hypothetical protein
MICDLQLRFGSLDWQAFEKDASSLRLGIANEIIE